MSCHTLYELKRKCDMCNITAAEDRNLSFHRFPLPGRHTMIRARVWAEYCYPTGEWSTEKSLRDLHSQHKMLCSKHFDDSSFTSSARIRLNNYAIPIGTQDLMVKFHQEQCATTSGSEQDTNISVEKPQVVEDGYEFFAKRQLVTLFSAPNYCGEFDNAGGMMSVDETLMCSFQILKPSEKKAKYQYNGINSGRPATPQRSPPKKK